MFGPSTSITVYHRVCCMETCGSSLPRPSSRLFTRRGTRGTITTLSLAPRALRPTDGQMGSSLAVWHRCVLISPMCEICCWVCHGVSEHGWKWAIPWYTMVYPKNTHLTGAHADLAQWILGYPILRQNPLVPGC